MRIIRCITSPTLIALLGVIIIGVLISRIPPLDHTSQDTGLVSGADGSLRIPATFNPDQNLCIERPQAKVKGSSWICAPVQAWSPR